MSKLSDPNSAFLYYYHLYEGDAEGLISAIDRMGELNATNVDNWLGIQYAAAAILPKSYWMEIASRPFGREAVSSKGDLIATCTKSFARVSVNGKMAVVVCGEGEVWSSLIFSDGASLPSTEVRYPREKGPPPPAIELASDLYYAMGYLFGNKDLAESLCGKKR